MRRDEAVAEELTGLIPQKVGLSLQRKGGLKLGRDKYLRGGEPDVEITADDAHETAVYIDDKPYTTFSTESLSINLRELDWQSGAHTIRFGENGRSYSFYIVASNRNSKTPSPLAHIFSMKNQLISHNRFNSPYHRQKPTNRTICT
ncbi:MAG: hypothetical protein IPK53_11080 [bacterium]|nr:hypothetical protein [bacterium]